ncbi:ribosomal L28 family-domain-containing protein [Lophiotrema nucula]|uniref:Large ribosomal subunit protein bL28m n=1 Tax=Lophiotrema nucula TaxID=690887 RepID=A0A6A5YJ88_9PLEO|nr:ribosomal L28 family-domain-containing protein [Lophiotrema nucula]
MPLNLQLLSSNRLFLSLPVRSAQTCLQAFSTTPPFRKDIGSHLPKHVIPENAPIPPYPYEHTPKRRLFKQAKRGLYGEQVIQFGNNVSPDSKTKTRRYWMPNVLSKSLYSVVLNKKIKLRVTSKVLSTMDREGGLDEYLLKESEKRAKELGPVGWNLRWLLMQQPSVITKCRAQAKELGIPQEKIDEQWPVTPESRKNRAQRAQQLEDELAELEQQSEQQEVDFEQEKEERRIQRVGNRYWKKGWAASLEEGVQLALERSDLRRSKREQSRANYEKYLEEVEEAGGIDAWKAARAAEIEQAGGKEAWLAAKKEAGRQKWLQSQSEA